MFPDESNGIIENNLKWLNSLVSEMPDLHFIEPVVQSLALINYNKKFTDDEMIIVGVSGFIATKARMVDEAKFQLISPNEYFHHAYILLKIFKKEEPNEKEFFGIIEKFV